MMVLSLPPGPPLITEQLPGGQGYERQLWDGLQAPSDSPAAAPRHCAMVRQGYFATK